MTNKNKFQKFALVLYIIFVIILFVLFSSVLIKTAQRGDSLSSTGDFSRDGVMDYETTEQNDTSEQDTEGSYELIQGVNGQYEYRCTKICSEECGRACDTCLMNGKSSKRSPKCCFDYSAYGRGHAPPPCGLRACGNGAEPGPLNAGINETGVKAAGV